ncbi:23S rRNA (adenine2030-N6)-methyltransferase [Marinospirillum celere]|uniref:Ribosomal RNA large subunit methyltransferase J n=1 Tax=Marinospirillum celere TaxID=1122252 RepID=A0A1I1ER91_9GAMM|nr:23S rRNA (adenine(2030)-N(6))-methyltransferase RlmJ [Marinospirillum celere]SFB89634.1 23S rRNA (adenine2030-N6)-methyltransferase [Marinospirillum celere]
MLSYRHSYHAGNFADLLKHLTLIYLLEYLNKKDKPYCYLDTHAGAGFYDLKSTHASKTAEAEEGIWRLNDQQLKHPLLVQYRELISQLNTTPTTRYYPGSPKIASLLLRSTDRLLLNELHSKDHESLKAVMQNDRRCKLFQEDAFTLLKASVPLKERRGLILMDPSYEKKEDYAQVIKALEAAHKRFATGIYAIWYPVISRQDTERWINQLAQKLPNILRIEHCPLPDTSGFGMSGSGMLVINPPYTLQDDFKPLLSELEELLRQGTPGKTKIQQLT